MEITQNTAVTIRYRFYDAEHPEQAKEQDEIVLTYLHGVEGILPGLKEALEGQKAGDEVKVTLTPDEAFGPRQENAVQRVPIKHLIRPPKRLLPGMVVRVNDDKQQQREVTVIKAGKFNVDVDLNHPFAGITLQFDMTVDTVREASESELAHGHAHGVGGTQH